jgi:hypothetical protein
MDNEHSPTSTDNATEPSVAELSVMPSSARHGRRVWWIVAIAATVSLTGWLEYTQGRNLICTCGRVLPWFGDVWASETSQHLLDPYSFTHLLHGFLLCGLITLALCRWPMGWQLWLAVLVESGWELLENSAFVIQRYRTQTESLGYVGDSVVNSMGDILVCALGFLVARRLGFKRSLIVFVVIEVTLLILFRDSLILNIIMLLFRVPWLQNWQAGH